MNLIEFIRESNRIEGIRRGPTEIEIKAHREFLDLPEIRIPEVVCFVREVAAAPLRDRLGLDVRIGNHTPCPGGPEVREELEEILLGLADGEATPYAIHREYEWLHPFMDGNGRSGRAIWAWQMKRDGLDPFALPFLHHFYYQTLDVTR